MNLKYFIIYYLRIVTVVYLRAMSSFDLSTRIKNAYHKICTTVGRRCYLILMEDLSFLFGSQKLMSYHVNDTIDDVPIDWLVRGCVNRDTAPPEYANDIYDIFRLNNILPLVEYLEREIIKGRTDIHLAIASGEKSKNIISVWFNFNKFSRSLRIDHPVMSADFSRLVSNKRCRDLTDHRQYYGSREYKDHEYKDHEYESQKHKKTRVEPSTSSDHNDSDATAEKKPSINADALDSLSKLLTEIKNKTIAGHY